ncbi:RdRP-domain-containing protein [Auriscalpium vulgare]|uniref:RdRP-domain-containing protein n=1 Tax=Auriscalpium vulgare TaxID=40419 RepID=A0ACB8RMT7_9AGAM|nr:RdRP-domain-containing protein [Auriscalpium vulgare]
MSFDVKGISYDADEFDVQKGIADVLHGPDLYDPDDPSNKGRLPNFKVALNESRAGGVHDGTAILTLPTRHLADRLFAWARENHSITVRGKKVKLFRRYDRVPSSLKYILEKAPYIQPEQAQERQEILRELDKRLRIEKVQFGVWYKPPSSPASQGRAFSVEYQRDYLQKSAGYLEIVYEHKEILLELGERMTEEQAYAVKVKFSSIRKMGIGFDFGKAFIIFDLLTPPVLEEYNYNNREREGIQRRRNKLRDRITALDDAHASVAPYAHHLRIILLDADDIYKFEQMCKVAHCQPLPIRVSNIDIAWRNFFAPKQLHKIQKWVQTMDWRNAFQIESLLRNGLLTTDDLLQHLFMPIEDVLKRYQSQASQVLRQFTVDLRMREPSETPLACLKRVCENAEVVTPITLAPGHFPCHHVTFTPTRMIVEGPYATQSNRVIRRYQKRNPNLIDNFVRVEFRDEDRLTYRWDRELDGTWFLQSRVGGILKNGFQLAGKHFEFLAYSTSALREHSVWFMSRFRDPEEGYVTAETIRRSLGDFSELMTKPSRMAARIAQAFTATDPSVTVRRDQWEEQDDIGDVSAPHSDGVGTISQELADEMWEVKCAASPGLSENRYQFRFLGYKGVVVVDPRMTGSIKMRLRPSQRKFRVPDVEEAEIEIARSFDYPNAVHFNRPVIMALEDRGVPKEAFLDLQEEAKASVYLARTSLQKFGVLLKSSGLGYKYHLAFIFEQLEKIGLDLRAQDGRVALNSPFIGRLLRYTMNHSLRLMKHKARIPVPKSFQLVGVADEGQAYIQEGHDPKDVYTLPVGHIFGACFFDDWFVCVQESPEEEPIWLRGNCVISRSPVIHPGDLQRVFAIGKPPEGKLCAFRDLKNVVVMPAVPGTRALASCLAGGDLDGDTFDIYYKNQRLLPSVEVKAAEYPPGEIRELPEGREVTVDDICDFVVEYINSDVVYAGPPVRSTFDDRRSVEGSNIVLCCRHLLMDHHQDGTFDDRCMELAKHCSRAVDYPKNGVAVNMDDRSIPHKLIQYKPDWKKAELSDANDNDYYESDRALGHLYRSIQLQSIDDPLDIPTASSDGHRPLTDPISIALAPIVKRTLAKDAQGSPNPDWEDPTATLPATLHALYAKEMRYIRTTHTLTDAPGVQLAEEEVVLGTILSHCTFERWRKDRIERMKLHVDGLGKDIRARIIVNVTEADDPARREGLRVAWATWSWCQKNMDKEVMESFSLIALGVVLDCLKKLEAIPDGGSLADR